MSAQNRLSVDELAALAPGDPVVIETSGDFRRPRLSTGTVVRISGPHLVVRTTTDRGGRYVEHFDRRDGVRVGGGRRAELVHPDGATGGPPHQHGQTVQIDAAYRAWKRTRDLDALRRLHAAIGDYLGVGV